MGQEQADAPPLPWSWVVEHLQEAEDYWLVTAGRRRPDAPAGVGTVDRGTARPERRLEHALAQPRGLGSGRGPSRRRARGRHRRGHGAAARPIPQELARIVEPYNQKYDWNWEPGQPFGAILDVEPDVVLAWRAAPTEDAQTSPFPLAAGKWSFHPAA